MSVSLSRLLVIRVFVDDNDLVNRYEVQDLDETSAAVGPLLYDSSRTGCANVLSSLLGDRAPWEYYRRRHHRPAEEVVLLVQSIIIDSGARTVQVNLTWTTPSTRIDGSPLAVTDIARTEVKRNGTVIGTPVTLPGAMAFSDLTPLTGSDVYTVDTVTTDGLVSADSNAVTINVAAANPASPISNLAGTLITP